MPVSALFWIVPARDRNTWWGLAQWHSGTCLSTSAPRSYFICQSEFPTKKPTSSAVHSPQCPRVPAVFKVNQRSLCFIQSGNMRGAELTLSWHSHWRKLFITLWYIFWTPRRSLQRTCAMSANIHCYQDIQQMLYLRRAITILQYVKYLENLL